MFDQIKIVFNENECARWGDPNDPDNTAKKLISRRRESLRLLAKFCGASKIEYIDQDKGEMYILHKKRKTLILDVCGNHYDGGWITIKEKACS
jgi:hypothetical protein